MIVFLKTTIAHINRQTRLGNATVTSAQQENSSTRPSFAPRQVDAVTGGTQAMSRYFATRDPVFPKKPGEP